MSSFEKTRHFAKHARQSDRNVHNNNTQTIGMCVDSATRANARSWRDKEKRANATTLLYKVTHRFNGHNHSLSRFIDCFSCVSRSTRLLDTAMATQNFVDAQSAEQQQMNLTQLQTEVSNGTYKFTRPLTIVNCATQDKYIVYASCAHCLKGFQRQNNGYYCSVHQWQRVPVYRLALRVFLQDWIGTEIWVTLFNEMTAKALGFTANSYVSMTSDEERYASLSLVRGARVISTIKYASITTMSTTPCQSWK